MSVSKWAYSPDKCDGDYCPGDCDYCKKADEEKTEENISIEDAIGFLSVIRTSSPKLKRAIEMAIEALNEQNRSAIELF